ncbi:MAG: protein kinase domain-containing protein [Egibacteraceae bacterium]
MRRTIGSAPRGEVDGLLDGRYQLGPRLGVGGMATIYRAWDVALERAVAVKVIHAHLLDDEEIAERFRREARHAAALVHPHIVTVFDQGVDGLPYIVMELVDGPSLRQVLHERGRLSPPEALAVLLPVCAALARAHAAGVVHRDIKPENVLIAPDGSPKVADFGIAHARTATRHTAGGTLIGSVHYLAPELIQGHEATPATDQYAVGVLAFELLTGRHPLPAETPTAVLTRHTREPVPPPSAFAPDIPAALDRALRRGTALNPADRFSSIEELATALRAAVPGGPQPLEVPGNHTLVIPIAAQQTASVAAAEKLDQRRARPATRSVVPALLLLTLLLTGLGAGLWNWVIAPERAVPSVVGLPEDQARSTLSRLDLALAESPPEPSLEHPEGTVLSQQPLPGMRLRRGAAVQVVLSSGPRVVSMPRVVGMTEAQARAALGGHAFTVTDDESFSAAPRGVVIAQVPDAGAPVREGAEVRLHVSKGRERLQLPIQIPDLLKDALDGVGQILGG